MDYNALTKEISTYLGKLHKEAPDTMQGFSAMSKGAMGEGELSKVTKELIALGIAISTRCDGCIGFHTQALARLGASRAQIVETCAVAVYMGGGPSLMYAAQAVSAFEQATS